MTAQLTPIPFYRDFDNQGNPLSFGSVYTYLAGTSTLTATYLDSTQTTPNTNPVQLNARGEAQIWLVPGQTYKFAVFDQYGNQIRIVDQIYSVGVTQAIIGQLLYPQTAAELAAGVTPVNYAYPPGNVLRYGALGDGVTDDTVAIQNALKSNPVVYFYNTGNSYIISSTLAPTVEQVLYGFGSTAGSSPSIQAAAGMNAPMIKWTTAGAMRGLNIIGTATSGTPLQYAVYISGTNNVTLQSCFFSGAYDLVHIDGTSFYTSIFDCEFYAAYHAQFYVTSVSASGVDMILRGCRFLQGSATATYCIYMTGLGSLIWSDVQCSGAVSSNGVIVLDQPASLFGGAQFTNCVFENANTTTGSAVKVIGGASAIWSELRFVNSFLNGQSYIGLDVTYSENLALTNCDLSSTNALGAFYSQVGSNKDWVASDCRLDGSSGVSPIQCAATATVSGTLTNCWWNGTAAVVNYANNASGVGYVNAFAINAPNAALPISLASDATLPGIRFTSTAWFSYTPTFTPFTGAFTTASAQGWYVRVNKTIHWYANCTITTVGTGAGGVNIGLPATAQSGPPVLGTGQEIAVTGKQVCGFSASGGSSIAVNFYDHSNPIAAGANILIGGTYNVV